MKNDMPEDLDKLWAEWFTDPAEMDFYEWVVKTKYLTRSDLTTPNQCCGAVGKEACTRYDQDGEECGRGVDDDLQKAIDYWKPRIHEVSPRMGFYIQTLITHALKTREKPVTIITDNTETLKNALKRIEELEGEKVVDVKRNLSDDDYTSLVASVRKHLELGMDFGGDPVEHIVFLVHQSLIEHGNGIKIIDGGA